MHKVIQTSAEGANPLQLPNTKTTNVEVLLPLSFFARGTKLWFRTVEVFLWKQMLSRCYPWSWALRHSHQESPSPVSFSSPAHTHRSSGNVCCHNTMLFSSEKTKCCHWWVEPPRRSGPQRKPGHDLALHLTSPPFGGQRLPAAPCEIQSHSVCSFARFLLV